jgi:hypothetical protein
VNAKIQKQFLSQNILLQKTKIILNLK